MRRKCISWWMTDVSWHFFLIFSHWLWWSNWRRFLRRRLQLIRRSTLGLPNDRFSIKVKMSSNMNTTGIINLKGSIELFSFSAKHIAIYILSAPMSPPPLEEMARSFRQLRFRRRRTNPKQHTFHFRTKIFISRGEELLSDLLGGMRFLFSIRRRRCHHRSIRQYQRDLLIYVTKIQQDWISFSGKKMTSREFELIK